MSRRSLVLLLLVIIVPALIIAAAFFGRASQYVKYTNSKFGFELEYPENMPLSEGQDTSGRGAGYVVALGTGYSKNIYFSINPSSYYKYYPDTCDEGAMGTTTKKTLNGTEYIVEPWNINRTGGVSFVEILWTNHGGNCYKIDLVATSTKDQSALDEVVESLKFKK